MWSYNLVDCGRLQEFLDHQVLILCELDMPMVLALLLWLLGRLDPFNWFYHASGRLSLLQMSVLSRPQSLCNRSFWWRFELPRCCLDFAVGVGLFVIGLSQISSFFSLHRSTWLHPLTRLFCFDI